jgi:hypothetical protein
MSRLAYLRSLAIGGSAPRDRHFLHQKDEYPLLRDYFGEVDGIPNIGACGSSRALFVDRYRAHGACHFQNSTALVYYLERADGQIGSAELDFVQLMPPTRDIGLICPIQHIENIKVNAQRAELKIVAHSLSHIKQKSQLKEHELRSVLQAAAASMFNGSPQSYLGCREDRKKEDWQSKAQRERTGRSEGSRGTAGAKRPG